MNAVSSARDAGKEGGEMVCPTELNIYNEGTIKHVKYSGKDAREAPSRLVTHLLVIKYHLRKEPLLLRRVRTP